MSGGAFGGVGTRGALELDSESAWRCTCEPGGVGVKGEKPLTISLISKFPPFLILRRI